MPRMSNGIFVAIVLETRKVYVREKILTFYLIKNFPDITRITMIRMNVVWQNAQEYRRSSFLLSALPITLRPR